MAERNVQLPLLAEAAPLVVSGNVFCCFEVAGEPHAWERPGAMIRKGHRGPYIHWYTRADDERYRQTIAWTAKAAMRRRQPTSQPVALLVHAFLAIPDSWHWRRKQAARAGVIRPTGTPDHDNILKVLCDSVRGIVWTDDALVVDGRCIKRYSDQPALRVEVREFVSAEMKKPAEEAGLSVGRGRIYREGKKERTQQTDQ